MSKQLTVVAHLVARPHMIDETKKFLLSLIDATRSEPGCIDYDLHQDDDRPAEFTFYENWKDRAEWDKHMETPNLHEFARRAGELFAVPPQIRLMTMISK
ncbi:antibiotic biosynthesis monooxygenase [Mesorhizobium sanjuanii]|uniref:Antibiotic biosynthesis monooxygenase n=1 Tax=Mesorhizobium sanjuanii TaxID=2037900 RepID=A0A2A6FEN4_9HYPH|nr:putative quinol monooxygenase [Mesorhizobium sanjuanii]PDQ20202.1 antibiotic biosynthesis monooxygenase [Mesorhizobium sanjuanii]